MNTFEFMLEMAQRNSLATGQRFVPGCPVDGRTWYVIDAHMGNTVADGLTFENAYDYALDLSTVDRVTALEAERNH